MAISKSKQAALNSKIKIASRKLKSAKQDAAKKAPGADVRVTTHQASIARLTALKGKAPGAPARS